MGRRVFQSRGPEWHETGRAVLMTLSQEYWVLPFGEFLAGYPGFLKVMAKSVLLFQMTAPFLLFLPFRTDLVRWALIASFWIFEGGLGLSLQLHLFPLEMMAGTLVFIPTSFWDRLGRRWALVREEADDVTNGGNRSSWVQRGCNDAVVVLLGVWIVSTVARYRRGR